MKNILTSTLIVAGLAGATLMPAPALAKDGQNAAFAAGAAAGVVGGAIIGSAASRPSYGAGYGPGYGAGYGYGAAPTVVYDEPQRCYIRKQRVYDWRIDAYRIRRVEVCR